jgi:DNA-binding response OmpR family regulator
MENPPLHKPVPAVLLIESDPITLDLYQRELCKSFMVIAFNGLEGVLETLAKQDFQAIVIEPEIDADQGWDLIHSIREIFPFKPIPVIVCSTRDKDRSDPALEISKYLTKPVLPRALREKVLEIINQQDRQ